MVTIRRLENADETREFELGRLVGMVLSGRVAVLMDDRTEVIMEPGDIFWVPPGHDSWVVGDEPYASLRFLGADAYAAGTR